MGPQQYSIHLPSGHEMPIIGIGTWQAAPQEVEKAVEAALEAGYRLIDTAFNYRNEDAIGRVLRHWLDSGKITRDDIFIVTKLPHIGNRAADVSHYLTKSLSRLQLDYVDLYLIHMPFGFMADSSGESPATAPDGSIQLDLNTDHCAVWKAMEEQVKAGKTRNIGVSNFNAQQLEHIVKISEIVPASLQVELHAMHQQKEMRAVCSKFGITVCAFSPLGSPGAAAHFQNKYGFRTEKSPNLLTNSVVKEIAECHHKSPAQILLRHHIQHNIIVIPKSVNATRIKENIQVFDFELTPDEVSKLDALDEGGKGRLFDFLFFKGVENHPEYPFKQN